MNVERLWTLLATAGFLLSLVLVADVWADSRWLRRENLNGGRTLVAHIHMRDAIVATIVQACFMAIGLLYLVLPRHPIFVWLGLSTRGWVLVGFLFLAQLLIIADSALNLWDRRQLWKKAAEHEGEGESITSTTIKS